MVCTNFLIVGCNLRKQTPGCCVVQFRGVLGLLCVSVSKQRSHSFHRAGINAARTDLVCFTDDDAIWNANFLKWLIAPFDDPNMGGVGSSQIMRPNDLTRPPTVFERIADMRLSGRMLEAAASTFYDGSVSCLSGRTALYHKRILTDNFPDQFCNELWWNKCAPHLPAPEYYLLHLQMNFLLSFPVGCCVRIVIWCCSLDHVPEEHTQTDC